MQTNKKIGTHSGVFHSDEVTSLMLLLNFVPDFKDAEIVRTRDMNVLKELDLICDVGGEYDHARHRYDHHQQGFEETFDDKHSIKLSSSGLIFKHFGAEIVKNTLNYLFATDPNMQKYKFDLSNEEINKFRTKLYDEFFLCLDAVDNGINKYPANIEPRYRDNNSGMIDRIGRLNPRWWIDNPRPQDELFTEAMKISKEEYLHTFTFVFFSDFGANKIMRDIINQRFDVHASGAILHLTKSVFWKEPLIELEKELGIEGQIKLVIYLDKLSGEYRVQSAPVKLGSFDSRCPLIKEWRGLDMQRLREISGIEDAVFCHHSGFIGGAKSYESTLKMAELSLKSN